MNKSEFVNRIYSEKYVSKVISKVKLLGYDSNVSAYDIILIRLFTSLILFILMLYVFDYGYIFGPIITLIYYFMFNRIVLDNKIKNRMIKLENEAMHFFEVLTLSLETGRNLASAIEVTTLNVSGILSSEFSEAVREVTFGKSLNEALTDMQERIPSETINNIILSLTQSNLYGNSIIDNLYSQIDYLREKRKLEVKGRISKVPIYISVISVLFFVPLLLLIILGPVILNYFK
ncbi:MAG: type II secretion system F family protein [Erysipelotrichaceae bacterium]|nr:type II secretion system F family protein [Erysipelotrichaceae bacterium]MDY3934347.1 type II secretion system F family protein [Bacilli bacterium]